jgi:HEAT repeat protein
MSSMASMSIVGLAALVAAADADFGWPGAIEAAARDAAELPDPQRLRAIERLTARAGERAFPVLVPLLADHDPSIRLFAARRLARAGVPAALEAATQWITSPDVPIVDRQFGLDVLREVPTLDDGARLALERALHDPEAAVRVAALDAIERHDVPALLPAVLAVLDDDNREVRLRAIRIVSGKRDARIALPLLSRIDDTDRQVRGDAVRALGTHPRATPALLRLMAEPPDEVRLAAMDALAALRADAAVPAFVALARRRPADEIARRAQLGLGKIGTPGALAALIALTRTPPVSAETRAALHAAGGAAVPALERELEAGTPGSAAIAAALLGEIGDRHATPALGAVLERRADLAPVALEALARLADPAAIPTLVRAAESSELETRRRAYAALLALRDARASVTLARGLADADAHVRLLSARLTAALGAQGYAPALAGLLADGDPDVRRAAAEALAPAATPSPALVTAILAGVVKPGAPDRDDDEWRAIGDGFERAAGPGDAARLTSAWKSARGRERLALARALAGALAGRPFTDGELVRQLIDALPGEGPLPLAAADALASGVLPGESQALLAGRFAAADPAVRARLCEAIGKMPDGGDWLAALMRARDETAAVRAAAAWAARGLDDRGARDALTVAAADDDPAVAANARAALAAGSGGRRSKADGWAGARLRAPDGTPAAGRWVEVSAAKAGPIWAVTDDAGGVRVFGLPPGPVTLRAPESIVRIAWGSAGSARLSPWRGGGDPRRVPDSTE